jgi:hypothetical protein
VPKAFVPRSEISEGTLPRLCLICGQPAAVNRYPALTSPALEWVVVSPILGILSFWLLILIEQFKTPGGRVGGIPFCEVHKNYWLRRAVVIIGGFALVAVLMAVGFALTPKPPPGANRPENVHWVFAVAGLIVILFLPVFLFLQLTAVRPTKSGDDFVVLTGASPAFVDALQRASNGPLG